VSEISWTGARNPARDAPGGPPAANLADLLERILDKGIVIVGDIRVNLLDIELLTIKLRLLVASVDRAKEMGIDWWEHDPSLSSRARTREEVSDSAEEALLEENRRLRERLEALEARALEPAGTGDGQSAASETATREAAAREGAGRTAPRERKPRNRKADDT
jgi:hypothetical protein